MMKYIELFAGIGGFRMALDKAGHECVWSNDIDRDAIRIYNNYYGEKNEPTDIRFVREQDIPEHDLIVGGFPCQSFSLAGRRKGFEDTRGTLFFEIIRIAKFHRTRYLLLENVKGLLSHDEGRTFRTILTALDELGYDAEWQVLNSKHFGVAQNRERVFIVGVLRAGRGSGQQILPIGESSKRIDESTRKRTQTDISPTIDCRVGSLTHRSPYVVESNQPQINVIGELDNTIWKNRHESARRIYSSNGLAPTLPTCTGGGICPKIAIPVLTPDRPEKRQNGRRFKEDGDDMFTLTSQDRHGVMVYDDYNSKIRKDNLCGTITTNIGSKTERNGQKIITTQQDLRIRRLTPKECYRLQGFCPRLPDGSFDDTFYDKAREVVSDIHIYKTAGNAVTVNVIEAIIKKMDDVK